MYPDIYLPISIIEVASVVAAVFVIFLMGFSLVRYLKIETKGILENIVISYTLAYCAFHLLAFGVFFTKSDIPFYLFFSLCLINLMVSVKKSELAWISEKKPHVYFSNCVRKLRSFYPWVYALLVFTILFYLHYLCRTSYLEITDNGKFNIIEEWDEMNLISFINVSRDFFFPIESSSLPSEPPMYFSWLGNLLPIFLIKFFQIDQIHSYVIWSPIFFHLALIFQIHYFVNQYTQNKWIPLFAVNLFFLNPFIPFELLPLRSLVGIFLVFSTLIFLIKYLTTKKRIFIVLTFSWSLLYLAKGNYLIPIIPALAVFYLYELFDGESKVFNLKVFRILFLCFLLPYFLFWFSKHYFSSTLMFSFFSPNWNMKLLNFLKELLPVFPQLIFIAYYRYKIFKTKNSFPILEKILLTAFIATFLFNIFPYRHLISDSAYLIFFGAAIIFPLTAHKLFTKNSLFYGLMGLLLISFPIAKLNNLTKIGAYETTKDELDMIGFLRTKTPPNSVIASNVIRYLDRPAFLSYLSYRKQFIEEGERNAALLRVPLEERIYDYFNFLTCQCSKKEQIRFLNKYKFLSHLIVYNKSFIKQGNIIFGMKHRLIAGYPMFEPHPDLFQPVYKNNSVKVYKVTNPMS